MVYDTIHDMKARLIEDSKTIFPDGSILEIVIWQIPEPTPSRPHGLKYRLNFSLPDHTTLVRFDNETEKGDHKHIRGIEQPYKFSTREQLIRDFYADILRFRGKDRI